MKKWLPLLAIVLVLALVLALAACDFGKTPSSNNNNGGNTGDNGNTDDNGNNNGNNSGNNSGNNGGDNAPTHVDNVTLHYADGIYVGQVLASDEHVRDGQGTYTWSDGESYTGQWKNNTMNGHGVYRYASGNVYTGDWVEDYMEGQGTMTYADGSSYTGQWKHDHYDGQGKRIWTSGAWFEGQWDNNNIGTSGIYHWADGKEYTGAFQGGVPNGKGTYTYTDQSTYTGDVVRDRRQGQGTMTWKNGDTYVGAWENDVENGQGIHTYVKGKDDEGNVICDTFDGLWSAGNIGGEGTYTWSDGKTYTGAFANGKPNGAGKMTYADAVYTGQMVNGLRQGKGVMEWSTGESYDGLWSRDKENGQGVRTYLAGKDDQGNNVFATFDGQWEMGSIGGEGTYTWADGKTYTGAFADGKPNGEGKIVYSVEGEVETDYYQGNVISNDSVDCVENGQGTRYYYTVDGSGYNVLDGQWVLGLFGASGTYTWADGKSYTGAFANGKPNGEGKIVFAVADGQPTDYYQGAVVSNETVFCMEDGQGERVYASGNVYSGQWSMGDLDGEGTMTYVGNASYTSYAGQWTANVWNGIGTLTLSGGDKMHGDFAMGTLNSGTYTWVKDNTVYEGTFVNGVPQTAMGATGTITKPNEYVYVGPVHNAQITTLADETGTMTWQNGNKFEGAFLNGEIVAGIINYANKDSYIGAFSGGLPHTVSGTHGEYHYYIDDENEDVYIGAFVAGERKGKGVMTYANGNSYDGDWVDGLYDGTGKFTDDDTSWYNGTWSQGEFVGGTVYIYEIRDANDVYQGNYQGEWENGKPNGDGRYNYPDNSWYDGHWVNGIYDGSGVLHYGNGDAYNGNWQQGARSGAAVYRFANGDVFNGEYIDDHMLYGSYTFKNNDVYTGPFALVDGVAKFQTSTADNALEREKVGTIRYLSKSQKEEYTGQFTAGSPNGVGDYTFDNGDTYAGTFDMGTRSGRGVYKEKATGNVYDGNFVDNQYDSGEGNVVGVMTYKQEGQIVAVFSGLWSSGTNVSGTLSFYQDGVPSGRYYEGEVHGTVPHGKGTMTYAENDTLYMVNWNEGVANGQGKRVCSDYVYEGTFQNGVESGVGSITWTAGDENGNTYSGNFVGGKYDSGASDIEGVYTYADGTVLAGQWSSGNMTTGTITRTYAGDDSVVGGTFVGNWNNGYTGTGTYTFVANGHGYVRYTGGFDMDAGLPAGEGTMTYTAQDPVTGTWIGYVCQ